MRFEKTVLTIVVAVAVLVMAVPFYRGLALSQLRQAAPCHERGVWTGATDAAIPNPHPKTDAQLLRDRPKDFQLRVALAQEQAGTGGEQIKSRRGQNTVKALMRDYPNEGIVYVLATNLPAYANVQVPRRIEGNGITPEAVAEYAESEPPTPQEIDGVRRYIALMDQAIAADPGNGWFHYMKAGYLYGLHRDGEALNEVHLASAAPRFTDYNDELAQALNHLCDLRGAFDPIGRAAKVIVIAFPSLARMRETARISAHLAYRDIRQGRTDQGVRKALDITGSGYNMARNGPTLIHSLVGKAIFAIGAAALDPSFEPKAKEHEAQQVAKLVAYREFLVSHDHTREAEVLSSQWRRTDRMAKKMRQFTGTFDADQNALERYYAAFAASAVVLTIALLLTVGWGIASLLTTRGGARGFWDRRSAVTSALLAALVLAPMAVAALKPASAVWGDLGDAMLNMSMVDEPAPHLIELWIWLGLFAAVMLAALLAGAALMLMRAPREGENRRMPAVVLLVAYIAAAGGLGYLAYVLDEFAESAAFLGALRDSLSGVLILFPGVAILIYGLIRALQSRFGRVRRSAPLTFIATVRYGMALAVALFALVYACLLPIAAHYGDRADAVARKSITQEAAFVRSAFK